MDAKGDWHIASGFTDAALEIKRGGGGMCGPDEADGFRSVIVVEDQPQTRVVVAMGTQGALIRTSVTGLVISVVRTFIARSQPRPPPDR
jgi:hypothetical protein